VVLLARYLGVENFGNYAFIIALVGFIVSITYFGLERVAIREIARSKEQANERLGGVLVVRWALSGIVVLAIAGYLLLSSPPTTIVLAIIVATVSELIWASGSVFSCTFKAFEEMHLETVTTVVFRLSSLFLIGLVIWFRGGIVLLLTAICGANIVRTAVAIHFSRSLSVKPLIRVDFPLWKRYAKEAFVLGVVVVFALGTLKTGVIALKYMREVRDVALFQSSQTVVLQMQVLPMSIAMALFPMLSKLGVSDQDRLARVAGTVLKYLFVISVPIAIVLHVFSGAIITIVFGRDFSGASSVLSTMAWCIIPLFMSSLTEFILISMNRQQDVAKTWALTFVVNVPLNILLIRSYGAPGAAMAVLASFVLLTLFQCFILAVHLKIPDFLRMQTRLLPPLGMVLLFLYWFKWSGWYYQVVGAASAIVFFIAVHFMIATISLDEIRSFAKKMHSHGS
jgi:O-antigen/teichoic acid export membrane protein